MSITEIQLYTALKQKLGETEAQQLVEFVKGEVKDQLDARSDRFATKEDLANAKVDIIRWVFGFFVVLMMAIIGLYFK
ncbi:MAG: hypothetical protein JNL47_08485 [Bacteroidia bacterium]|nr:hypothetical protein [Bacteroidia bacterium]